MTFVKGTYIKAFWVSIVMTTIKIPIVVNTSVSIDNFRICAWKLPFHCTRCKRSVFNCSDIEAKIWWQYQDNNQLSPSVTLRTISLTIWFARIKLLVFAPTAFSLLLPLVTFTFLDFLSRAFFAWASFNFTCQARCLCRTLTFMCIICS